jgi:hypothetical protein
MRDLFFFTGWILDLDGRVVQMKLSRLDLSL